MARGVRLLARRGGQRALSGAARGRHGGRRVSDEVMRELWLRLDVDRRTERHQYHLFGTTEADATRAEIAVFFRTNRGCGRRVLPAHRTTVRVVAGGLWRCRVVVVVVCVARETELGQRYFVRDGVLLAVLHGGDLTRGDMTRHSPLGE